MRIRTVRHVLTSPAAATLIVAAALVPAYAVNPTGPGPQWATLAPVPTALGAPGEGVEGMSVARAGNTIVAAAGYDNFTGDTATTRLYDIAADAWSIGANAPGANSEGAGISHDGLVYSVGGRGPAGARNDLWSYDIATDTWTVLASMQTGRTGLAVASVGNQIYAIGGRTATGGPCTGIGASVLGSVERYDVALDTWTTVASLPSARSDLAAAVIGGKIYVFGGCDAMSNQLADVDVYDPVTDTWSTAPADMPTIRVGMYAVANKGGTVYVIGGCNTPPAYTGLCINPLSTNESYKVAADAWTTGLLPMPTARAESGAVGHGGRIYIVGGSKPSYGASTDANEVFKP